MNYPSLLVLVTLVPLLSTGCVTASLWEKRAGLIGPGAPPPAPLRVERAIRDGRGAFHLLVDCGEGRRHHVIVHHARPEDPTGSWPHAGRTENAVILGDPTPLPTEGVPLETWSDDGLPPAPPGPPDSPAMLDPPVPPGPRRGRIELHGDSFELVHPDGRRELLAHVPPRRRPWPRVGDDDVTAEDVGAAVVCGIATPLTLAADVAVIVLGVVWYPIYLLGR